MCGEIEAIGLIHLKLRMVERETSHLLEVIALIRCHLEPSAGQKRAMNRLQEFRRHHSPALVPALRPRIGKQEIKNVHRVFRQQITNCVRTLQMEHSQIVDPSCFTAGLGNPSNHAFDSKKIRFGMAFSQVNQKRSIAAAKIDM